MVKKYHKKEIERKLKEVFGNRDFSFLAFDEFGRVVYEENSKPTSVVRTISKEDLGI